MFRVPGIAPTFIVVIPGIAPTFIVVIPGIVTAFIVVLLSRHLSSGIISPKLAKHAKSLCQVIRRNYSLFIFNFHYSLLPVAPIPEGSKVDSIGVWFL